MRKSALRRDIYTCQKCNRSDRRLAVHHKLPISEGGTDVLDNLVTLCFSCHKKEHPRKYTGIKTIFITGKSLDVLERYYEEELSRHYISFVKFVTKHAIRDLKRKEKGKRVALAV